MLSIWSFAGLDPPYNFASFDIGVTYDASAAAGASDVCKANVKATWPKVTELGASEQLRQLRLADQHDLNQLGRGCLEIGEEAHLLEHLGRQVLRLIHDQEWRRHSFLQLLDQLVIAAAQ